MSEDKTKKEIKQAAALKYDATKDRAPYIVGLGQGLVAENILKVAQQKEIPVVEDKSLAAALHKLGIGDDIPEDLYSVIAEVLVFITRLDEKEGKRFGLDEVMKRMR